jgi:hypothetical protein
VKSLCAALDCKRDILTLPMPDPRDDSAEAHRLRSLILGAADSTIEQTLTPAAADDDIEEIIEERLRMAKLEIKRLDAERNEYGDGKTKKPN